MKYIKIIILVVVILLLYFIMSRIKLVHQDILPEKDRNQVRSKAYVRALLMDNNFKIEPDVNNITGDTLDVIPLNNVSSNGLSNIPSNVSSSDSFSNIPPSNDSSKDFNIVNNPNNSKISNSYDLYQYPPNNYKYVQH
jgi:hypothetical protein